MLWEGYFPHYEADVIWSGSCYEKDIFGLCYEKDIFGLCYEKDIFHIMKLT